MKFHYPLVVALLLGTLPTAQAAELAVRDAWVRGTAPGQSVTGAFMVLKSGEAAALTGAASPVAGTVEIHATIMDNGVMKMRAQPRLELPAGKKVKLEPGGYHIMLMDLKQQLKVGEKVALTLKLEEPGKKVREVAVEAEVRELSATGGVAENGHAHHHH